MANLLYTKHFEQVQRGLIDMDASGTVYRALLERSTSTYTPNKDHDFLDSFTTGSGVELSVSGYARVTAATKAVNIDDTNDRTEFTFDPIEFGALASGQTIKAIIIYVQTGGNDSTPEDDVLVGYFDTMGGSLALPLATNGGTVTFTVDAEGLIQTQQG